MQAKWRKASWLIGAARGNSGTSCLAVERKARWSRQQAGPARMFSWELQTAKLARATWSEMQQPVCWELNACILWLHNLPWLELHSVPVALCSRLLSTWLLFQRPAASTSATLHEAVAQPTLPTLQASQSRDTSCSPAHASCAAAGFSWNSRRLQSQGRGAPKNVCMAKRTREGAPRADLHLVVPRAGYWVPCVFLSRYASFGCALNWSKRFRKPCFELVLAFVVPFRCFLCPEPVVACCISQNTICNHLVFAIREGPLPFHMLAARAVKKLRSPSSRRACDPACRTRKSSRLLFALNLKDPQITLSPAQTSSFVAFTKWSTYFAFGAGSRCGITMLPPPRALSSQFRFTLQTLAPLRPPPPP